jgi:hypothetical protein
MTDKTGRSLYEINLPYNLSPNSLKIYYSGYIFNEYDAAPQSPHQKILLTDKHVVLEKDSCWYPTIPGPLFKFNLSTLSPSSLGLYCESQQHSRKVEGDFNYNNWVQNEPVDGIYLFSPES